MAYPITDQGALTTAVPRSLYGGSYDSLASQQGSLDQFLASLAGNENNNRFRADEATLAQDRWAKQMGLDAQRFAEQQRQFDLQKAMQERQFNVGVDQANAQRADANYWRGVDMTNTAAQRAAERATQANQLQAQLDMGATDKARQMWEWQKQFNASREGANTAADFERQKLALEGRRIDMNPQRDALEFQKTKDQEVNAQKAAMDGNFDPNPVVWDKLTPAQMKQFSVMSEESKRQLADVYQRQDSTAKLLEDLSKASQFNAEVPLRSAAFKWYEHPFYKTEEAVKALAVNPEFSDFASRYGLTGDQATPARLAAVYSQLKASAPDYTRLRPEDQPVYRAAGNGFHYTPSMSYRPYFDTYLDPFKDVLEGFSIKGTSPAYWDRLNGKMPAPEPVHDIPGAYTGPGGGYIPTNTVAPGYSPPVRQPSTAQPAVRPQAQMPVMRQSNEAGNLFTGAPTPQPVAGVDMVLVIDRDGNKGLLPRAALADPITRQFYTPVER